MIERAQRYWDFYAGSPKGYWPIRGSRLPRHVNPEWVKHFQIGQKATTMGRLQQLREEIVKNTERDDVTFCWNWKRGNSGNGRGGGYGRMSLGGQTVAAHRVAYTLWHGYIPSKKQIDHRCKNRACCNPEHLELVTYKENQRRRDKKCSATKIELSVPATAYNHVVFVSSEKLKEQGL
jgi:hypothetical protein